MSNYINKLRDNGYEILVVQEKLIIKVDEFNYTLLRKNDIFIDDVTGEKYPVEEIYQEHFGCSEKNNISKEGPQ